MRSMQRSRLGVLAAVVLFPVAGWAATVNVTVGPGFAFAPSSVTIASGDTVQWNWAGAFHTSTSDTSTGAEVWDSGTKSTGSFSHTFNTVGDWPYYCKLHSVPGGTVMNGVVHVAAPAPTLTSINPVAGPTAGGTVVTFTGTNFAAGCGAFFGTTPAASTTVSNSTTILATTPAHAAGTVDVSVSCTGGTPTLPNAFTFAPAPSITNVQPSAAAPGAQVTITGSNFQNGATVTFGSTPSNSLIFVDGSTLRAIVPNVPAGPAAVRVTNPDSQSATFEGFTSLGPAAIPALSGPALLMLLAALMIAGLIALRSSGA
jgi:plastocyanin